MQEFTITTRMPKKEYANAIFFGLYKKPGFILVSILGLFFLTTTILNYFKITNYHTYSPMIDFLWGLFFLISPALYTLIVVGQFNSNPNFQHDIKYTFSENELKVEGRTFRGEFLWGHIIKYREIGNFLILYHSKNMGNFIDKTKLTTQQLQFIKSKVRQK
ncbi:MAG: YcxB family protein [Bacteroidetes bacterium]|nr:YcxB family protein [Bacteroidota bacterium]